jgi:hypothetical protein
MSIPQVAPQQQQKNSTENIFAVADKIGNSIETLEKTNTLNAELKQELENTQARVIKEVANLKKSLNSHKWISTKKAIITSEVNSLLRVLMLFLVMYFMYNITPSLTSTLKAILKIFTVLVTTHIAISTYRIIAISKSKDEEDY